MRRSRQSCSTSAVLSASTTLESRCSPTCSPGSPRRAVPSSCLVGIVMGRYLNGSIAQSQHRRVIRSRAPTTWTPRSKSPRTPYSMASDWSPTRHLSPGRIPSLPDSMTPNSTRGPGPRDQTYLPGGYAHRSRRRPVDGAVPRHRRSVERGHRGSGARPASARDARTGLGIRRDVATRRWASRRRCRRRWPGRLPCRFKGGVRDARDQVPRRSP